MMVCILVVFITLFEFTLLIWLRKTIEKNLKKNNVKSVLNRAILKMRPSLKESCLQDIETNEDKQRQQERVKREKSEVYNQVMRLAEKYGFVAVAGSFVMFNVIYWPWLLLASGHFKYLVNFDYNSPDPWLYFSGINKNTCYISYHFHLSHRLIAVYASWLPKFIVSWEPVVPVALRMMEVLCGWWAIT